jgi:alpha-glucosidase
VVCLELQGNILRETLSYLVDEIRRADVIGTDKGRCGCLLMSTMGLPCACSLAKTVKEGKPISLVHIYSHWKRL